MLWPKANHPRQWLLSPHQAASGGQATGQTHWGCGRSLVKLYLDAFTKVERVQLLRCNVIQVWFSRTLICSAAHSGYIPAISHFPEAEWTDTDQNAYMHWTDLRPISSMTFAERRQERGALQFERKHMWSLPLLHKMQKPVFDWFPISTSWPYLVA